METPQTNESSAFHGEAEYAEVRTWDSMVCGPYGSRSTGEPSVAVHSVFKDAIPGAFGVDFLSRMIARGSVAQDAAEAGH